MNKMIRTVVLFSLVLLIKKFPSDGLETYEQCRLWHQYCYPKAICGCPPTNSDNSSSTVDSYYCFPVGLCDAFNKTTCNANQYQCGCFPRDSNCTYGLGCYEKTQICDGVYDCLDGTDEVNCTCPVDEFQCACYESNTCAGLSGCLPSSKVCDRIDDCKDYSDEVLSNCPCWKHEFECDSKCIPLSLKCNGKLDCDDSSDETNCTCSGDQVMCGCIYGEQICPTIGQCIPNTTVADGIPDCIDQSDEPCLLWADLYDINCGHYLFNCTSKKSMERFMMYQANNSSHCIQHHRPCQGHKDQVCTDDYWMCSIPQCQPLDGVLTAPPVFYRDYNNKIKNAMFFFCFSIFSWDYHIQTHPSFKCLGYWFTFPCSLSQINLYDQDAQCADKSDLCFVNGEFRCFLCLDKRLVISKNQVCDGVIDCYDLSDECLCENQTVCKAVLGDSQSTCPPGHMHCYNQTDCLPIDSVLCNQDVNCLNMSNTKYCYPQLDLTLCSGSHTYGVACDGRPECFGSGDECESCPNPAAFCNDPEFMASPTWVCDGIHRGYYNESLCPKRYICSSGNFISIDVMKVCDGNYDCDDKSDEAKDRCENKRFYCLNGNPLSVPIAEKEDGIKDCSDGSDECPPVSSRNTVFSNQKEMIANPILTAFIWIMGILALIGNILVVASTFRKSYMNRITDSCVNKCTQICIVNLSVSDMLMGIYLLAVAAKSAQFSGSYCYFDAEWRSSTQCSILGALCVISSQTSALTMALISVYRLVSVWNPFLTMSLGPKWIILGCFFTWCVSLFIAIIPTINFASGYFVTTIWFPNFVHKRDFVSFEAAMLLAQRISPSNSTVLSWLDAKRVIDINMPGQSIKGEFGYYAKTSVCLPRLFASESHSAWGYSLFIITLNFIMFIFMIAAYVLIYRRSNRMAKSKSNDTSAKMQKRISRLLLTDFCCWIPICILSYLSLGGVVLSDIVYVLAAAVLLPINSALNPLLYSSVIDNALDKCKKIRVVSEVRTTTEMVTT